VVHKAGISYLRW